MQCLPAAAEGRAPLFTADQEACLCNPQETSWECAVESASDARSTCDGDTLHLARGSGDDILLINRQDGLPIDAACQAKPAEQASGDYPRRQTRSDDKVFRLTRMPVDACR